MSSTTIPTPPSASTTTARGAIPWLWIGLLLIATVVILRLQGRIWWCACRTPTPFSINVASSHNSQHLLDPYAFSHLLHGVIFFWALKLLPRLDFGWKLLIALAIEAGWEILENSPLVIERYRAATASLGYSGDSIVNSFGDVLSCALGFVLAAWIGWRWSIALFLFIEIAMLAWIRDNLTLNVVMLLYPLESIKRWQMGG